MSARRYRIEAQFDTKTQAEQAVKLLLSLNPAAYRFSAHEAGQELWVEAAHIYGAHDVRL